MKKLIKVAMIMAGVGAMLSFAGCGKSSNDPGEIATDFFNAIMLDGKDVQNYIKKYCADNAVKKLETDKSFIKEMASIKASFKELKENISEAYPMVANLKCKYVVKDVKIDGEKAMVSMKMQVSGMHKLSGETFEDYIDDTGLDDIEFTKINGTWKLGLNWDNANANTANACVSNMKQIQAAWEQALLAGKEVKSISDLCGADRYLKVEPECPLGEKYQIDKDGNIVCPSGATGHVLPQ